MLFLLMFLRACLLPSGLLCCLWLLYAKSGCAPAQRTPGPRYSPRLLLSLCPSLSAPAHRIPTLFPVGPRVLLLYYLFLLLEASSPASFRARSFFVWGRHSNVTCLTVLSKTPAALPTRPRHFPRSVFLLGTYPCPIRLHFPYSLSSTAVGCKLSEGRELGFTSGMPGV